MMDMLSILRLFSELKKEISLQFFAPAEAITKRKVADVNKIQLILSVVRDKKIIN